MGNYLEMADRRQILALLELGWSYRRIERETGIYRETVARGDNVKKKGEPHQLPLIQVPPIRL